MMSDALPIAAPNVLADEPAPPAAPTVSDLLAQSRRAHLQYHQHLPRMAAVSGALPQKQAGDADAALAALKSAAAARAQAELIDPTHSDRAWIDDAQTMPHQETLVFYLQQLAK